MRDNILTLIIGKRSNLSSHLNSAIDNILLISTEDIEKSFNELGLKSNAPINIIFNNFQTSTKLNSLDTPTEYISKSILSTAKVLEYIKNNNLKINKIIYTSSSSVYGNNTFCSEDDDLNPLSLHSALKIANEKMIEKFSVDNNIDYTIARIFNMYGGDDSFSIISKIILAYKNSDSISLVNSGNSVRDFISIDDVVKIYDILLKIKDIKTINIGTGMGVSIKSILKKLEKRDIVIDSINIFRDELKVSTADNSKLLSLIGDYSFMDVHEYIEEEILC
ncbi:MAG: NAD(P)-dependent oxidoreductase [Sulfurovum sp.]